MYSKALALNRVIIKDIGNDIILSYKRASNILENELKNKDLDLSNTTDPVFSKMNMKKIYIKRYMN